MQTTDELQRLQSQPLDRKIIMTKQRIMEWVSVYGEGGVYVSFSGGKDSTVLLDIVRNVCGYDKIPAVFVDVPTQFPELKEFAERFDNLVIVKPKMSFYSVCEKYGFPLISKEVCENVQGAKKYLKSIIGNMSESDTRSYAEIARDMIEDVDKSVNLASVLNERLKNKIGRNNMRLAIVLGWYTNNKDNMVSVDVRDEDKSIFSQEKYKFFLTAPFDISNKCCTVMKKEPAHSYSKRTGRMAMTAQMATESRLRTQWWIKNGCNGFNLVNPVSNPMAFWTENDVLEYIYKTGIPICSVYGDVVEDFGDGVEGQLSIADFGCCEKKCKYKTTGCKRTGCCLCGYGAHLKAESDRFLMLKKTHPGMYGLIDLMKNNGVTYREAMEWVNENMEGQGRIYL